MSVPQRDPPPTRRVHPADLVVLALAAVLAAIAYVTLFRNSPVPTPVDPLLGSVVTVEFGVRRDWHAGFPDGDTVLIEEYLQADVVGRRRTSTPVRDVVELDLRVRGRETQRPEAMTLFRTGVRRGTVLRITDDASEVRAEVTAVRRAGREP